MKRKPGRFRGAGASLLPHLVTVALLLPASLQGDDGRTVIKGASFPAEERHFQLRVQLVGDAYAKLSTTFLGATALNDVPMLQERLEAVLYVVGPLREEAGNENGLEGFEKLNGASRDFLDKMGAAVEGILDAGTKGQLDARWKKDAQAADRAWTERKSLMEGGFGQRIELEVSMAFSRDTRELAGEWAPDNRQTAEAWESIISYCRAK